MAKRNIRLHLYHADAAEEEYRGLRFVCGQNTDCVLQVHKDDMADVLKAFRTGFWQVFFDEALMASIWKDANLISPAAGQKSNPSLNNCETAPKI